MDTSAVVTKVNALILEVETDQGDIRQLRFSAPDDAEGDQTIIEMEVDDCKPYPEIKVDFPFVGTIHYEIIASTE